PRARALLRDLQLEARRDEHESSDMYGWRWGLDRDQGDAWVALVGPWCVASGVDDRFADRDAAREALHARARALARRARLGPRSVVLAIASADDDARLWTLYPRLPGLDAELRSRGRGPSAARDALVDALAEFVARLLAAAPSDARLCPDRLALEEGRVVALPDVLGDADRERPLGVALLLLAERLGDAAAVDRLAERLRALAPPLLATLRSSLAAAAPADDGALAARLRERLGVASPRLVTMSR
ncbi:MAG: hypothetical protein KC636_13630, partial [Myxococcales bacterium]|nr:hypothetical protein [Myxococcales bacterium]